MSNADYTVVRLKIYKQNRRSRSDPLRGARNTAQGRSPDRPILQLKIKTDKGVVELLKTGFIPWIRNNN